MFLPESMNCYNRVNMERSTTRNIILTGFMGTGKSSVGRALAERLNRPFVDTDAVIARRTGRPIAALFAEEGEGAFRLWEATIAGELAETSGLVIATGGGLMLDPANAEALGRNGRIFCLTAAPEELLVRLAWDGTRPLLQEADPLSRINDLLAQRAAAYARFPQIDTNGRGISEVVEAIVRALRRS